MLARRSSERQRKRSAGRTSLVVTATGREDMVSNREVKPPCRDGRDGRSATWRRSPVKGAPRQILSRSVNATSSSTGRPASPRVQRRPRVARDGQRCAVDATKLRRFDEHGNGAGHRHEPVQRYREEGCLRRHIVASSRSRPFRLRRRVQGSTPGLVRIMRCSRACITVTRPVD